MKMKKLICFIVLISLIFVPAKAESDVYSSALNGSGLGEIEENLSDETRELMDELGIDISDAESFSSLDFSALLPLIESLIKRSLVSPLSALGISICVLLILGLYGGLINEKLPLNLNFSYIGSLILCTTCILPFINTIIDSVSVIKSLSIFMLSFIPIFAGVLIASGKVTSSAFFTSSMMLFSNVINNFSAFIITPFVSIYLCLGITSAISENNGIHQLTKGIKTLINWVLGFVLTIFGGVLSIQSIIGKGADNMAVKTSRFFIGSFVPVVGNALSEALTTVTAGIGLLKSTMCGWCMLVIFIMILPIIIELFLYRMVMMILSSVSKMMNVESVSKIFDVSLSAASFIIGIIILIALMYFFSLCIISGGSSG